MYGLIPFPDIIIPIERPSPLVVDLMCKIECFASRESLSGDEIHPPSPTHIAVEFAAITPSKPLRSGSINGNSRGLA